MAPLLAIAHARKRLSTKSLDSEIPPEVHRGYHAVSNSLGNVSSRLLEDPCFIFFG